jgi:hypothetical protein
MSTGHRLPPKFSPDHKQPSKRGMAKTAMLGATIAWVIAVIGISAFVFLADVAAAEEIPLEYVHLGIIKALLIGTFCPTVPYALTMILLLVASHASSGD